MNIVGHEHTAADPHTDTARDLTCANLVRSSAVAVDGLERFAQVVG